MTCKKKTVSIIPKKKKETKSIEIKTKEKVEPLPSDPCDYSQLGDTKKNIAKEKGFFSVPELTTKGAQGCGIRKTLVFYFDDEESYQMVVDMFDAKTSNKGIPYMNTAKLIKFLEDHQDE